MAVSPLIMANYDNSSCPLLDELQVFSPVVNSRITNREGAKAQAMAVGSRSAIPSAELAFIIRRTYSAECLQGSLGQGALRSLSPTRWQCDGSSPFPKSERRHVARAESLFVEGGFPRGKIASHVTVTPGCAVSARSSACEPKPAPEPGIAVSLVVHARSQKHSNRSATG